MQELYPQVETLQLLLIMRIHLMGSENILLTLKEFTKGHLITVFGAGGNRDRKKRPLMGQTVERYSDICIVTSDNPRSEEPVPLLRTF